MFHKGADALIGEFIDGRSETERFAFYQNSLPVEVLDGANASVLRTTTVLRPADGRMNGLEGYGDNDGCRFMNGTHVKPSFDDNNHFFLLPPESAV